MKKTILLLLLPGLAFINGCMSPYEEEGYRKAHTAIGRIRQSMRESRMPHTYVVKCRKYALEKLTDETDAEADIIQNNNPVIDSNYEGSEYSFTWTVGKHHKIEVLTTPPPCEPITVYRVRRTFYP